MPYQQSHCEDFILSVPSLYLLKCTYVYLPFAEVCNAKGCNIVFDDDLETTFKRHELNPYFDWLGNYTVGTMKLLMLANKALERATTAIFSPGGPKYECLKMAWEEIENATR